MPNRSRSTAQAAGAADYYRPESIEPARQGFSRGRLLALLGYVAAAYLLFMGWINRDGLFFGSNTAPHYMLGVFAGVLMLMLLYYPLWKVVGGERWKGALKWWFRAHVLFGVLAPVAVLYHAGFSVDGAEGRIALVLVAAVAVSGLVGRWIYGRTHSGASGRRQTLDSLSRDKAYAKYKLATVCEFAARLRSGLQAYEIAALTPAHGLFDKLVRLLSFTIWTAWHERAYRRELEEAIEYEAHRMRWSDAQRRAIRAEARRYLALYLDSVRRMSSLAFFDNLYSLWHALHLPLLMMMVAAAVLHVLNL